MVDSFFPSNQTGALDHTVLLSGPPSCGKTSLLFQFAFNRCVDCSGSVVFICNKRRLENNPPCLAQGVDTASEVMKRVHMKYVDDYEQIKKYFAAFHFHDTFPSAVIIDDFGDFFDDRICQLKYGNPRGRDLAVSQTLAMCYETIEQANMQSEGSCKLLLSDTHQGDGPRLLFLYRRWISCIIVITGDGLGFFTLKMTSSKGPMKKNPDERKVATYSIAMQHLVLEGYH